jgi:hypothetical protein
MIMIPDNSVVSNTVVDDDKTVSYQEVTATTSSGSTTTSDSSTNTFDFTGNTNRDIIFEEPVVVSTKEPLVRSFPRNETVF